MTSSSVVLSLVALVAAIAGYRPVAGDPLPPSALTTTTAPPKSEPILLSSIMPTLEAIQEDTQNLLIKNSELRTQILAGLQAQAEAKLKLAKEASTRKPSVVVGPAPSERVPSGSTTTAQPTAEEDNSIDYEELDEFNKWVEVNLDYAVKNTYASIEALKEEAEQNNGRVDYTEQAVRDGIEGVKYWQSAVIFQDKTLKNEKFEGEI